ncbi:MAG: SDR family oxidoreductase [Shinella sp.]|nr:SDR family oxidoreductase [Shinella sp.]
MVKDLKEAVVVITGASSGIGEATAYAFARAGARLVLAARGASALHAVARSCRALGADVLVVPTDVTDADAVKELAERARSFGRIDVWVSNVGVGAVGEFTQTPIEAHEQVIRVNLMGHFNDAHAAIPIFLEQGYGTFINMISLGGFAAAPFAAAYSASKFGLKGFSEALRAELEDLPDIHVCDIYPSFIDTPGIAHGANYMRRKLSAPPPVYDARKVAAAIVRTARHPRDTVTVGQVANLVRLGHFLAPKLSTRLTASFMRWYFARARAVPATNGNLYRPPAEPGGIDGGLRSDNQRAVAVIAGSLLAGLALGALVARNGRARRLSPR